MQSPIVLFDHIRKTVVSIQTGPAADKRLAEIVAEQNKQVATSGRPK
jgi:thiamine biosynthesis lipoprotein ApbE